MKTNDELNSRSDRGSQIALVLWIGFLSAGLLEGMVFSLIDPSEVHWSGHMAQPTRQGIYTIAFLCFWLISTSSAWVVLWLSKTPEEFSDTEAD